MITGHVTDKANTYTVKGLVTLKTLQVVEVTQDAGKEAREEGCFQARCSKEEGN